MTTTLTPPMPATRTPPAVRPSVLAPKSNASEDEIYRISVSQYHRMIDRGIIAANEPVELLEGYLVKTMSRKPPHCHAVRQLNRWFGRHLPDEWLHSCQGAMTVDTSEPEPDLVVMRGPEERYRGRHPGPDDVGLVIEVAETSLAYDEGIKLTIFARNRIPAYWVVNLTDGRIQVYTGPTGRDDAPTYSTRQDYELGSSIPVVLDGQHIGSIRTDDILI